MRKIVTKNDSKQEKLIKLKSILKNLPQEHILNHQKKYFMGDLNDDEGLYDLFLHSNDIAFSVDDIYNLLEKSDMYMLSFIPKYLYDPKVNNYSNNLITNREKESIAELMREDIIKHIFYCTPKQHDVKLTIGYNYVPTIIFDLKTIITLLEENIKNNIFSTKISFTTLYGHRVNCSFKYDKDTPDILKSIDGRKTLKYILNGRSINSLQSFIESAYYLNILTFYDGYDTNGKSVVLENKYIKWLIMRK